MCMDMVSGALNHICLPFMNYKVINEIPFKINLIALLNNDLLMKYITVQSRDMICNILC